MSIYTQLANQIIKEQELLIGPIAWDEAEKVKGLQVNRTRHVIELQGDEKSVVDALVEQYEHLFGRASEEVCKEAVKDLLAQLPKGKVPKSLQ